MKGKQVWQEPAVLGVLAAAMLFGSAAPLAKMLLAEVSPWLLAGLLYLGSGVGLLLYRRLRHSVAVPLPRSAWPGLITALCAGGVAAPVLLMWGLWAMPASGAALLLNAEGVFTALVAWLVFREHLGWRIGLGMGAIFAGAALLHGPTARPGSLWPTLAILGACLLWAIDNNLTRKVSLADASWIAGIKGLAAGVVNLVLAALTGVTWPPWQDAVAALILGSLAYGASLTLFIVGLRQLGTARTSAYFSVAPFFGAALAVWWLKDPVRPALVVAGVLMGLGVWLHVTEEHRHAHRHEVMDHEHEHVHDAHHQHEHDAPAPEGAAHSHWHHHAALHHTHAHFPDTHHRHRH